VPRPTSATLTEGELRIMRVLWDKGEGTVNDVVDSLKAKPKPAYNSVLTLLRILEKKHYVTHRKDGRAFIYKPVIARAEVRRKALKTLVNRFFEGSPGLLMLNLLEDERLSSREIEDLKKRIEGES
jgi:BlaI family transcriptional regulator, penicillinase repressor